MAPFRVAAVAAHFGRDRDACFTRMEAVVADAAEHGADLIVLPAGALGGSAVAPDGPEVERLAAIAGPRVVCAGLTEGGGAGAVYNAAVCLSGDGVLGRHRRVHQPATDVTTYAAGAEFCAFDTPAGRLGMLIDYDKTFPEAARTLALDGAELLAILSAWPASVTNRAPRLVADRQTRLFDLYDSARAAENQVLVVSANQTGTSGQLRYLGRAKVVGPGGEILAGTGSKSGLAVADVDPTRQLPAARRILDHLAERRAAAYRL